MTGVWSERKIRRLIEKKKSKIRELEKKYGVPAAVTQAVMLREMRGIDLVDYAADLIVRTQLFRKKDSSTGPMQIYGKVALRAFLFAADRGLPDLASLGFPGGERPDENRQEDVFRIWKRLRRDKDFNLEAGALNLLVCADEMTGRSDFSSFSEEELKLVLTRYNANVRHITAYGEETYRLYRELSEKDRIPGK